MATVTKETSKAEHLSRSLADDVVTGDAQLRTRLDYKDLQQQWGRLLDKKRLDAESNLLHITTRISKLDPIAQVALAKVKEQFNTDEKQLRKRISQNGWATELLGVNKRINRLRFSENKRVILAAVYPALLAKLLDCDEVDEALKDEVGFTNDVMFELEDKGGPLDKFAQEVVALVGNKHRINFTDDNILRDLVAHQVRAGL